MTPLLFLTQMLGFLLQTLPVSVLCFVPLEDERLRYPRKQIGIGFLLGLTLVAVAFAILVSVYFDPKASVNTPLVFVQNSYMSITFLACVFAYSRIVHVPAAEKTLILLLVVCIIWWCFTHYQASCWASCHSRKPLLSICPTLLAGSSFKARSWC